MVAPGAWKHARAVHIHTYYNDVGPWAGMTPMPPYMGYGTRDTSHHVRHENLGVMARLRVWDERNRRPHRNGGPVISFKCNDNDDRNNTNYTLAYEYITKTKQFIRPSPVGGERRWEPSCHMSITRAGRRSKVSPHMVTCDATTLTPPHDATPHEVDTYQGSDAQHTQVICPIGPMTPLLDPERGRGRGDTGQPPWWDLDRERIAVEGATP